MLDKKKNILFIFINNGIGGSGYVAAKTALLASTEFNVTFLSNKKNSNFFVNFFKNTSIQYISILSFFEYHFLIKRFLPRKWLLTFYFFCVKLKINRIISKFPPNITHIHSTEALLLVDNQNFNKTIFTIHETGGLLINYNYYYGFLFPYFYYLEKMKKIDLITSASESVLKKIFTLNPLKSEKFVIRNGCSSQNYDVKEFNNINAIFVGGSVLIKNFYFLLELLTFSDIELLKKINFKLKVLGHIDNELRTFVNQSKLKDFIILIGNVKLSEYYNILSQSNIYINTSLHETIPNSLMDAITYSLVPFVVDVGGIGEIIENDKTGIILNSSISESINTFKNEIMNKEKLKIISRNAHQLSQNFTWEKIFEDYKTLYNE